MISLRIIIPPILMAIVWNVLDASPTLFFYDKIATVTGGWQHQSLQGKTVWITGASSGIGAAIVCELFKAGVGHVVLSSRNRDKLEQVATHCKQQHQSTNSHLAITQVSIVPYDATQSNLTEATVDSALAFTGGTIDILILNAGVYQNQPTLQTSQSERDTILRINYQAPIELAQSLIQRGQWNQRQQGHIVAVASVMAHGPHGLSSAYAASKAALRSYFFSLSTEEASWLRVDVACPGGTNTGLWDTQTSQPTKGAAIMEPERVAQLLLTGVAGPQVLFFETWISKVPGLLWLWLRHYMPGVFHLFVHVLAYVRVPVWEQEGLDVLDVPILLHKLVLLLMGRYP